MRLSITFGYESGSDPLIHLRDTSKYRPNDIPQ